VVIEPWLDRVLDLSIQLAINDDSEVRIKGITRFLADGRGQYLGTVVGRPLDGLPPDVTRFVAGEGDGRWSVFEHLEALGLYIGGQLAARGHRGLAGVDAFVYRVPSGELRLKPLVEVNPRCTMGHIALALSPRIKKAGCGLFAMVSRAAAKRAGFAGFADFGNALTGELPDGVICLSDPEAASIALAVLATGRDLSSAIRHLPSGLRGYFDIGR
jgi:hypothetical protein